MNKTLPLILMLVCVTAGTAAAATQEWSSSFSQGVTENMVDDGNGNKLNVSCSSDEQTSISAYATIAGKQYASTDNSGGFDVLLDGKRYSNPFFTDCDACNSNFKPFWDALRKAKKLQITVSGKTANLSTKNIQTTLLPLNHQDNACRSTW